MMKDENELRCRVVAHGCFKQTPFPCHNAMAAWHGNGKKLGHQTGRYQHCLLARR